MKNKKNYRNRNINKNKNISQKRNNKKKKLKSISSTGLGTGAIIGISIGGILLVAGISYAIYYFVSSSSDSGGGGGGSSSTPGRPPPPPHGRQPVNNKRIYLRFNLNSKQLTSDFEEIYNMRWKPHITLLTIEFISNVSDNQIELIKKDIIYSYNNNLNLLPADEFQIKKNIELNKIKFGNDKYYVLNDIPLFSNNFDINISDVRKHWMQIINQIMIQKHTNIKYKYKEKEYEDGMTNSHITLDNYKGQSTEKFNTTNIFQQNTNPELFYNISPGPKSN